MSISHNKVLPRWRNYENSKLLPSIRSQDGSSSRTRTLFWNYQVQELQKEVNCMNDSKDFQDAESIRSGNSHVTSRPVSFPPYPIPDGMLRRSFVSPGRREGAPSIWDTHGCSGNVLQIHRLLHQLLILKKLNPPWKKHY